MCTSSELMACAHLSWCSKTKARRARIRGVALVIEGLLVKGLSANRSHYWPEAESGESIPD
jgi:hypothetical protein